MKLSREKMADWRWLNNQTKFYVFFRLLIMANFKDKPFEMIMLKRGQLVFSYESLSKILGISLQTLRTTLRDLQATNEINIQSTRRYSILTICNYDSWQNGYDDIDDNSTYEPTYNQHTDNIQSTLSEIIKEGKEDNKKEEDTNVSKKKSGFVPPTLEEVVLYVKEKGYHFDAEKFYSYYESNGWMVGKSKMKKWKAACNTWEKNTKQDSPSLFSQSDNFPPNPRHGDTIGYDWYYDGEEGRWIKDGEKDRLGRVFSVQLKKWLI